MVIVLGAIMEPFPVLSFADSMASGSVVVDLPGNSDTDLILLSAPFGCCVIEPFSTTGDLSDPELVMLLSKFESWMA